MKPSNLLHISALLVVVATGLFSAKKLFSAEARQGSPQSTRIRALNESLDRGERGAEQAFWAEIGSKGTPLIETVESQPNLARVTFLWRGAPTKTRSVKLMSGPQILSHFTNLDFVRLPKSDVWFLTLDVPMGWRVGYVLAENGVSDQDPGLVQADPLNRRPSSQSSSTPAPDPQAFSIFETPGAPPELWLRRHEGIAAGKIETYKIPSRVLGCERTIEVYVPHGLDSFAGPVGSIYLFDGEEYLHDMRVAEVLDNLIGERRISPLIGILIHDLPGDGRDHELSCDPKFTEFVVAELLPWVRGKFHISIDPRRTAIGGVSLGGLEASFLAYKHPELFGAVLAQSPSFWWRPDSATSSANGPWMAEQYTKGSKLPVRFFVSSGHDEIGPSGTNTLNEIRQMRDALAKHGYDIKYEEVEGQHDPINWRLTLPDGLLALDKGNEGVLSSPASPDPSRPKP